MSAGARRSRLRGSRDALFVVLCRVCSAFAREQTVTRSIRGQPPFEKRSALPRGAATRTASLAPAAFSARAPGATVGVHTVYSNRKAAHVPAEALEPPGSPDGPLECEPLEDRVLRLSCIRCCRLLLRR